MQPFRRLGCRSFSAVLSAWCTSPHAQSWIGESFSVGLESRVRTFSSGLTRKRAVFTTRLFVRGCTLLLLAVGATVTAQPPPRSIALPVDVVEDRFIAYLFALLHDDLTATISGDELRSLFPEYDDGAVTPMDFLDRLERSRTGEHRAIRLSFQHRVEHPAPITIFGDHPVMLYSSKELSFREEQYARTVLTDETSVDTAYILTIESGELSVDFAAWLDFLLGSLADDIEAGVVLAARLDDRWYGALVGHNPDGEVMTTVYDMAGGRFLARPPRALTLFAAGRLEARSAPEGAR